MSPIRIALLLCDTPIDEVAKKHGDYRDIFGDFFRNSVPDNAPTPEYVIDSYDVHYKQEYPENIDAYNAVVMTGSGSW